MTTALEPELVGLAEISGVLGIAPATVASWRQRGQLPRPRWQLKAGPVWTASEIREWFERQRGSAGIIPAPDRSREAIDLSTEPHRAEVFAHYGLAMGEAQMVEQHLAAVLVLLHPDSSTRPFHDIVEAADAKTMGTLREELRRSGAPVIGVDKLKTVVDKRNLLAHRFFRDPERSVRMTTHEGRLDLIAELDDAAREFWLTAQYLRAAEVRLAMQRGVSKHDVMERVRRASDGSSPTTPMARRVRTLLAQSPEVEVAIEDAFAAAERTPEVITPVSGGAHGGDNPNVQPAERSR